MPRAHPTNSGRGQLIQVHDLILGLLLLILLQILHPLIIHIINTNHIFIGGVHIIFELIGGRLSSNSSIIIRSESALPGSIIRSSLQYNSRITFHGILTISSTTTPISTGGLGNILSPLLLCCCETISIRLNALSPRLSAPVARPHMIQGHRELCHAISITGLFSLLL